ncbi:MAG: chemotaxis-specific protein-glutamate methyltransferase CheB [Candidatus Wallbacteria bacterium]|nr:chemotaxis-specific protein-glutamate methyltransferase CheB [Candidatus Wallbacteria bacterium]
MSREHERAAAAPIRVLVADDSPAYRGMLRVMLEADGDIAVAGEAGDGQEAVQLAAALSPAVITMDLEMPGMDGVEATRRIAAASRCPILIVTSPLVKQRSTLPFRAIEAGAMEIFLKPLRITDEAGSDAASNLRARVRALAGRPPVARREAGARGTVGKGRPPARVAVLAASTGGPAALQRLFAALAAPLPGCILVVQHIGAEFQEGLVQWWSEACAMPVRLASAGDRLIPGTVLVAPSERHLLFGVADTVLLQDGPRVHGCKPAADVTMESAATALGAACAGAVLTGMGADGARGLLAIRDRGGWTAAQDEASCAVYGMPREAARLGAAEAILPIDELARGLARAMGASE